MFNDAAFPDHSTIELPVPFIDALSATASVEEVLVTAARWLSRIIGCARCSVAYLDHDILIAQEFRPDGRFTPVATRALADESSCRGGVLKTGQPVFLDRAGIIDAGGPVFKMLLQSGINSILITPMFSSGQVIGTIASCRQSADGFSKQESHDLITVGKWIAAQVRLLQQLRTTRRLAETDNLTGLANRAYLMKGLSVPKALVPDPETGMRTAVLAIDLDHFKIVNDTQGHTAGDIMLGAAASVMQAMTGPDDIVARIGGDEFLIVTRTDDDGNHLETLGAKLIDQISQPVIIDGVVTRIGASIGTAIAGPGVRSAEQLIANADLALYEVKRAGRGFVRAFRPEMRTRHDAAQSLMTDLQYAAEHEGFEPYFQPQVCLSTGTVTGVEILARWPHPTLGMLAPADFIDMAIENNLMDTIDAIVRRKGLAALRQLRDEGWKMPKMAFNASAAALDDPDLAAALLREVHQQGLCPSDMVLEIREASLMESTDGAVARNVASLAKAGFFVALDDFGTGCAAISNLTLSGVGAIKLDRTLVSRLPDPGVESILRAVINLAHELGLNVTASGVETAAQFAILRNLGCSTAQGFGVAAPMPMPALQQFLCDYGKAPAEVKIG